MISDVITTILELFVDIKHWFKVKKRRKFEKENKLPKKRMLSPMNTIAMVIFIISIPVIFIRLNRVINQGEKITTEKIMELKLMLAAEKKQFGTYPTALKNVIRNNPLRKNSTKDYWKNEFSYTLSKDSLNYTLISAGKDQVLHTADDIKITNN